LTPVLAFDIETVPDVDGIRKLHALPADLPDAEVAEVAFQKRRAQTGNDFLPSHLQKVVVISCVLRNEQGIRIFSIGEPEVDEAVAIQRFFEGLNQYVPMLVSWNGRGFDVPVLVARGLIHGVTAACFWDTGNDNKDFRFSNYINRFHDRHVDLMDVLSIYGGARGSPLDDMARLCGFPGKLGVGGAAVWQSYREGRIAEIRDYCEADCANTYLLYLRFQMMRCVHSPERYREECALLRELLGKRPEPHWAEFLKRWQP
jgi:hypothetical protein